jgi:hypothetical protein
MTCDRCQGLMCPVFLHDWGSGKGHDNCRAFRCLLCGEIVDDLILQNRNEARGLTHGRITSGARHSVPFFRGVGDEQGY